MARTTSTNFTGGLDFTLATAGPDLFKKEDVEILAQAVDLHDHSAGKGLPVTAASSLTVTGATTVGGVLTANGGLGTTTITTSGRITSGTDLVVANGTLYLGSLGDTVVNRSSAGVVGIQALVVAGNATVAGNVTVSGTTTHNNNVTIDATHQLTWPGGAGIGQGTLSTYTGNTVLLTTHAAVGFDLTVGHGIICQVLTQTSDMSLKSGATVMTDDDCMSRVRDPGMSVYSYQLTPPEGESAPETPVPTPTDIGFDAAQVYAASPEFAALRDGTPVGVSYSNMAALLWGALRQLDGRVQVLETP